MDEANDLRKMTSSPLFLNSSDVSSLVTSSDQLPPIMDQLRAEHRKEAKDLQSRITQKKKAATKKTRKGINDECENLERQMKERHAEEIAALNGDFTAPDTEAEQDSTSDQNLTDGISNLDVSSDSPAPPSPTSLYRPTKPSEPSEPTSEPKKKQNRAKARLARRAAEQEALATTAATEALDLPDLKAKERARMLEEFSARNLSEKEIRADGHCLYSAFADQLTELGIPLGAAPGDTPDTQGVLEGYKTVRGAAADYITQHAEDFAPFLEEPLDYYVFKVRNTGEWGGQLELMALAKRYGVKVRVLQGDGRVEDIEGGTQGEEKDVWLAYYRHGFGLGEHYNSLRKDA